MTSFTKNFAYIAKNNIFIALKDTHIMNLPFNLAQKITSFISLAALALLILSYSADKISEDLFIIAILVIIVIAAFLVFVLKESNNEVERQKVDAVTKQIEADNKSETNFPDTLSMILDKKLDEEEPTAFIHNSPEAKVRQEDSNGTAVVKDSQGASITQKKNFTKKDGKKGTPPK